MYSLIDRPVTCIVTRIVYVKKKKKYLLYFSRNCAKELFKKKSVITGSSTQ